MGLHTKLWIRLETIWIGAKRIFRLVAVPLRTLALDISIRMDVDQRRAMGLGDISLWPMDLGQRLVVLEPVRLLSLPAQLVAACIGRDGRYSKQYLLVPTSVLFPISQLLRWRRLSSWRRQQWRRCAGGDAYAKRGPHYR